MFLSLYLRYLRSPNHPVKVRILGWIEKFLFISGKQLVTTNLGYKMYAGPIDCVERTLLLKGTYEPETLAFLKANLHPGDLSVCSGTAYGLHMLVSIDAVGENGQVVGIDPQPSALIATHRNLCANGFRNRAYLVGAAIDADAKLLPITVPAEDARGSFSLKAQGQDSVRDFHAQAAPLTEILEGLGLGRPDVMVLDVEGHEVTVLRSLTRESKPKILIAELHPWMISNGHTDEQEFYDVLAELGYEVFDLSGKPVAKGDKIREFNIVAVDMKAREPCWVAKDNQDNN